ncbi:MAG: SRPBCC family protein [Vicinamibacteria bacterium]|nr:SRPBCC family protein [Vicinamibacteria bacterium]
MLLTILALIVLAIAIVLIFASTRPDTFRVERSGSIGAPPEKVFALIEDFHKWTSWSPWENLDPDLKRTYGGAEKGRGATYAWQGNAKAGEGRMEILEATPNSRVLIKIDFAKPFEAHNQVDFAITSEGGGSRVVWSMTGPQAFMMKVMCLFMNMDNMVGKDFEKGLASLKAVAEQA